MTKKDYILIAKALRDARVLYPASNPAQKTINVVAESLSIALKTTNPLFSETRFLEACGVPDV